MDTEENGVVVPGSWRANDDMIPLQHMNTRNRRTAVLESIRNEYREYFMSPAGELAWQYQQ